MVENVYFMKNDLIPCQKIKKFNITKGKMLLKIPVKNYFFEYPGNAIDKSMVKNKNHF